MMHYKKVQYSVYAVALLLIGLAVFGLVRLALGAYGEIQPDGVNIVGLWHLNESSGDASDSSGNGYTCSEVNTVPYAPGFLGNAADLNGTNDSFDCGDINEFDALDAFSICVWLYHDTITTDDGIYSKVDGNGYVLFLRDDVASVSGRTDCYKFYINDTDDTDQMYLETSLNSSPLQAWTFVCATYEDNNVTGARVFINAEEDAFSPRSTADINNIDSGGATVKIGQHTAHPFDGRIDEFVIYNRALSAAEIKQLYAMQKGGYGIQ